MITSTTTTVYCRVDAASRRIIGLSDVVIPVEEGKPVYTVAANDPKLSHYIVETDVADPNGMSVRLATAAEITEIDTAETDRISAFTASAKYAKAFALKKLYDEQFIRRFRSKSFYTTTETIAAWQYSGTDPDGVMADIKAQAEGVNNMYNEWRFGACQTAIDAMLAAPDMGVEIDEDFRSSVNDDLDNFLVARGIDITIYSR